MSTAALLLARSNETRSLTAILEAAGCVTRSATSLSEAGAAIKSFRPQLAVIDWAVVVHDLQVITSLRKQCPGLRVILLAPPSMLVDARDFLKDNEELIPQPVDPAELQAAVGRARTGKATSFVATLLALPGKFLSRAKAGRRDQVVHVAELERSRVFQGLHAAICARAIDATAGLEVWDRVAQLEELWAQHKEASEEPALLALAERYQHLFERMSAMAQSGAVGSLRQRKPGEVDLTAMQTLFERVREGQVSREQLQEAWTVWSLPAEQREKNALFKLIWDAKRRKSGSSQRIRAVQPAGTKAADLIEVPTDSKKMKRVKSGEGSTESQRMRKVKQASAEAQVVETVEPPATASAPEPSPSESQRRRKVKPPSDAPASGGSRRIKKVQPPSQPALAPGPALGAPIQPAPRAETPGPERPKFVRKDSADYRPTL